MLRIIFALIFSILLAEVTLAQPILRPIRPGPVGDVYIRGIHYKDHSRNTRVSPTVVAPGQFITISSNSLIFQNAPDVRVILQDVNQGNAFGVTAFRLTNVQRGFMTLTAQVPNLALFRGRSFHVTVFVYGSARPFHYANPGVITIQ